MNSRIRGVASCFGILLLLSAGCQKESEESKLPQTSSYFKTHFQDESQFIVEEILSDLVEMTEYARRRRLPEKFLVSASETADSKFRAPNYDVKITVDGKVVLQEMLQISQPIWAAETYLGPASKLRGGGASGNRHDPNDVSVLLALVELKPTTLESANQKVSSLLATNFNDPTLHEMAAVVLGAFALREFSGNFYDVRLPLCRMTAHLALARALGHGAPSGLNGRVAQAMLCTLMNNQESALKELTPLAEEAKLKPWVRALRARNTHDYRELAKLETRNLLESIMYFFAISRSVDTDAGWPMIPAELSNEHPDFLRIAYAERFSVGLGHQLHDLCLKLEMAEIQTVHALITGVALRRQEVPAFLNQQPERCFAGTPARPEVRIIGQGQWAAFLQRHLCESFQRDFGFLQRSLGVPEEAKRFADQMQANYGNLRLYPFVRRFNCTTEAEYRQAVDAGQPVTIATPHLVSPDIWNYLGSNPRFAQRYWPGDHPHINEWHKHNPPPGTAYHPKPRLYHPSLMNRPDTQSVLAMLHELAPYDEHLADALVDRLPPRAARYDQAEKIYQPMLGYSSRQLTRLATLATNDPPRYEQLMTRSAKLDPVGYFALGDYFASRQEEAKAAGYYEEAIKLANDDVQVANRCGWLVNYYFRHQLRAKAEELADRAAEVYSARGLRTKADLLEMEERYDEAMKIFLAIEERYQHSSWVAGFCVRYKAKTGDARFDEEVRKRLKALFPRGLEPVGLKDFASSPDEAVLISEDNDLLRTAGLKKGDLIVALDGLRVYDMTQYQYVRDLTNAPPMKLIVWDGQKFEEKLASPPKRRFGVPFFDYRRQ